MLVPIEMSGIANRLGIDAFEKLEGLTPGVACKVLKSWEIELHVKTGDQVFGDDFREIEEYLYFSLVLRKLLATHPGSSIEALFCQTS